MLDAPTHQVYTGRTDILKNGLKKPFPVPSLDAFIGVSYAVDTVLDDETRALLDSFRDLTQYAQMFGNILDAKDRQLHFAPKSPDMEEFVHFLELKSPRFAALTKVFHTSESDAEQYIADHASISSSQKVWGLIVGDRFPSYNSESGNGASFADAEDNRIQLEVQYSIRLNHTTLPASLYNEFQKGLPDAYQRYFTSGFLSLQKEMDSFVQHKSAHAVRATAGTNLVSGSSEKVPPPAALKFLSAPMPSLGFERSDFYSQWGFITGFTIVLATLLPVSQLLKVVMHEKEAKLAETMKIMGLTSWVLDLSWFLSYLLLFFMSAIGISFVCTMSFLPRSDFSLILTLVSLLLLTEMGIAYVLTCLVSSARTATIAGPATIFLATIPKVNSISNHACENINFSHSSCNS
jgi:hypothetical protein